MRKRQVAGTTPSVDLSRLQLLSVSEAAQLLCVGRTTIYALIADGELQTVRVRSDQRILVTAIFEYIERQRQN